VEEVLWGQSVLDEVSPKGVLGGDEGVLGSTGRLQAGAGLADQNPQSSGICTRAGKSDCYRGLTAGGFLLYWQMAVGPARAVGVRRPGFQTQR
jgi:hypothetical protein